MTGRDSQGRWGGESGSALLTSVLLITLITGGALAATMTTALNQNKAHNLLNDKQAIYLAEAGLAHGKMVLSLANWNTYATGTPTTLIASTSLSGVGSYTVTTTAASGGHPYNGTSYTNILMTATGTGPNNASTSVSSLVIVGTANYSAAFITNKNFTISGSPTIDGTAGSVQANKNLTISGSPHISGNAEAVGTYTVQAPGSPVISGFAGGGQPSISVNTISAMTYYGTSAIDYYLWSDGTVYDGNFNTLTKVASGGSWNCWTFDGTNWNVTCSTPPNGTYWVYSVTFINSNVGTASNPWIATILSYYSIEVETTATPLYMRPPAPTDGVLYKSLTQNLLFAAGYDLNIKGAAGQNFGSATNPAIARAYEQIAVSGNSSFNGYLIAQDSSSVNSRVTANAITGNMHLTYNGNVTSGLAGTPQVQSTLY